MLQAMTFAAQHRVTFPEANAEDVHVAFDLDPYTILPCPKILRRIQERMCAMVARILAVNLVWLKDVRRKALKPIPHEYSDEMSQKNHVVSITSHFSKGVTIAKWGMR